MIPRLVLLLLCACILPAFGQIHFESYTRKDGLTSSEVTATLVSSKDVVWFGTSNGLSAYYDSKWYGVKNLENSKTDKLATVGKVLNIFEDNKQNIWVGSEKGFFLFNGKFWTTYEKDDDDNYHPVRFMEDRQGRIWITLEYIQIVNPTVQLNISLTNGMLHMFIDERWIDFNDILGGSSAIVPGAETNYFTSLFQDSKGNIWVGSMEGAYKFEDSKWIAYKEEELKTEKVNALVEDHLGHIWAALDNGVAKQQGNEWEVYQKKDGLVGGNIYKLQEDKKGRMWAFAKTNQKFAGLNVYDSAGWTAFDKTDFKLKSMVESLTFINEEVIAFARDGVAVFRDGKWFRQGKKDGLHDKTYTLIYKDRFSQIWLAGENHIYRYVEDKWSQIAEFKDDIEAHVMLSENKDSVWIASVRQGVFLIGQDEITQYTVESGLADNRIYSIFKDNSGMLWVVSKTGVSHTIQN